MRIHERQHTDKRPTYIGGSQPRTLALLCCVLGFVLISCARRDYVTRNEWLGLRQPPEARGGGADAGGTTRRDVPAPAQQETTPTERKGAWVNWVFIFFAGLLVGASLTAVLLIGVQPISNGGDTPKGNRSAPSAAAVSGADGAPASSGVPVLDGIFEALNAGKPADAHRRLNRFVEALPMDTTRRALRRFLDVRGGMLPGDYASFFEHTLASILISDSGFSDAATAADMAPATAAFSGALSEEAGAEKGTPVPRDPGLLLDLASDADYAAQLVFNTAGYVDFPSLAPTDTLGPRRLVVTGGYTSPFGWPAGLAVDHGRVVNGALQSWDGLVVLDSTGQVHLVDLDVLAADTAHGFDPRGRFVDYRALLDLAEQHEWSMVQSHLLLHDGELRVGHVPGAPRTRRRALFTTADGTPGVYDTRGEALTLYAFARRLRERFGASAAVNLDTGTYTYGVRYRPGQPPEHFSALGAGVQLSNVLVIDY